MGDIKVVDTNLPPVESMDEFAALSKSLEALDQSELFKQAFNYVKKKTNVKTVNIGLMMNCFLEETIGQNDKFALGWTTLAILRDRKEHLLKTMTEEDFLKITQTIIENMC